jgi:citrate synthase
VEIVSLLSFYMLLTLSYKIVCSFSRKRKMSGFGHRVYKNYDPRAKVIRKLADEVFSIVGRDPLIEVSFPIRFDHRQEFFFLNLTFLSYWYCGLSFLAMCSNH